jgi:hypothetical protein
MRPSLPAPVERRQGCGRRRPAWLCDVDQAPLEGFGVRALRTPVQMHSANTWWEPSGGSAWKGRSGQSEVLPRRSHIAKGGAAVLMWSTVVIVNSVCPARPLRPPFSSTVLETQSRFRRSIGWVRLAADECGYLNSHLLQMGIVVGTKTPQSSPLSPI